MLTSKICSRCKLEKTISEFHVNRRSADGLRSDCKTCKAEKARAWYAANRERAKETSRAYYAANLEREADRVRAWHVANRKRNAETKRAWREANAEKIAEQRVKDRIKYPGRQAARNAVSSAVRRNDFPPASTLVCDYCQEAQAQDYHHHKGYAPEHQLDVIPVCRVCHKKLHKPCPACAAGDEGGE